jgi:hypothetical protein
MTTVRVEFIGGIAAGHLLEVDYRDALRTMYVARLDDELVLLSINADPEVVTRVAGEWHLYWMWPRSDPSRLVLEYRAERPPDAHLASAWFSASN